MTGCVLIDWDRLGARTSLELRPQCEQGSCIIVGCSLSEYGAFGRPEAVLGDTAAFGRPKAVLGDNGAFGRPEAVLGDNGTFGRPEDVLGDNGAFGRPEAVLGDNVTGHQKAGRMVTLSIPESRREKIPPSSP
ncbi:hypothetical protein AVEN_21435-1 [Araneus ventricosus]|uniref:Uncharacterized protein n=1 Tax=Araneus ventricosus TaxID=182803 RepID=A0A4Y2LZF3_ARAVE|nr:hypothetical protein AVEN_21435-1 [Araneus ventricosus]